MFEVDKNMENAYQFSRFDLDNPLATCTQHPIVLEEHNWTTCEHYVQAKIVRSPEHAEIIDKLATGALAIEFAKPWYRLKIKNYKKVLPVLMTRALYTKVQMYEEVREALISTQENLIVETSQYDHFWGIGRDLRGYNHLGRIWMNIRKKISSGDTTDV